MDDTLMYLICVVFALLDIKIYKNYKERKIEYLNSKKKNMSDYEIRNLKYSMLLYFVRFIGVTLGTIFLFLLTLSGKG